MGCGKLVCGIVLGMALSIGSLTIGQQPDGGAEKISAREYPAIAQRVEYFEQRINSGDPRLRVEALREAFYFRMVADEEMVRFLRRMAGDSDPGVRGQAIRLMYNLFLPIEPGNLPTTFTGYHDGQKIDLENPRLLSDLMGACSAKDSGATPGYAAYVLGIMKCKAAIGALKGLSDHPNIFVRYTAGRALAQMGDPAGAKILEAIVQAELIARARATDGPAASNQPSPGREPHYAMVASYALIKVAGQEKAGLDHLIDLLGFFEKSNDPNDAVNRSRVQRLIAATTGQWVEDAQSARKLIRK